MSKIQESANFADPDCSGRRSRMIGDQKFCEGQQKRKEKKVIFTRAREKHTLFSLLGRKKKFGYGNGRERKKFPSSQNGFIWECVPEKEIERDAH